jgi:hypothetical protein
MSDPIERALNILPGLNLLVDEILDLSGSVGQKHSIEIGDILSIASARAGYMAMAYVAKQDEHLQSVRVLVSAGQHRDAWLITRTMMEGCAQLVWAHQNQPEGPDEWFWYGVIEDWRQLQKNMADGGTSHADLESVAQEYLAKYGELYYSDYARKKAAAGKSLPADPYRHKWKQGDAASVFRNVEWPEIYEGFYRTTSGWLHWSPRQVRLAVVDDGDTFRHQTQDPSRAAQALAAGMASLHRSLEVLNNHFELGLAIELDGFANRLHLMMRQTIESYHDGIG